MELWVKNDWKGQYHTVLERISTDLLYCVETHEEGGDLSRRTREFRRASIQHDVLWRICRLPSPIVGSVNASVMFEELIQILMIYPEAQNILDRTWAYERVLDLG